ncbi:MAG: prepilin-type N-terminal cleavage/methylation domain-containing protein [Candidatus Staskawiczbacteria bacterium]|nr:prepilin-type N-terminal cleavage/methylation domain-containing protein [Candidatus Staskawiczbacteria bacterium]
MQKGFTLIELIVVIAITAVLSGIILFSVTQYINRGKDSNISGNLAILVPAGEVWYNGNGNSYNNDINDFCNPLQNSVIRNTIAQMPQNSGGISGQSCYINDSNPANWSATSNYAGVCCYAVSQAWAACAPRFSDGYASCVDSRGVKNNLIPLSSCTNTMTLTQCPSS